MSYAMADAVMGEPDPQAARLTVAILLSAGVLIGLAVLKASRA
jgi:hypothetical protein